jgi:hypothetical protein
MNTPPLTIASDQEAATALLGEIAALCAAQGAQWHPDLRAEVADRAVLLRQSWNPGRLPASDLGDHVLVAPGRSCWSPVDACTKSRQLQQRQVREMLERPAGRGEWRQGLRGGVGAAHCCCSCWRR